MLGIRIVEDEIGLHQVLLEVERHLFQIGEALRVYEQLRAIVFEDVVLWPRLFGELDQVRQAVTTASSYSKPQAGEPFSFRHLADSFDGAVGEVDHRYTSILPRLDNR